MLEAFNTPWKIWNFLHRAWSHPWARLIFTVNNIPWGREWKFYGLPIVQKHRQSHMQFGDQLQLRSALSSNPLGPNHRVFLTTWKAGAKLIVGDHFGMTGGVICAAESITIGDYVILGANTNIIDTDFHPLDPQQRRADTRAGQSAPVVIEDNVFVGMNTLILKGSYIGKGSVIGAGSVVSGKIPAGVIAAGNPVRVIRRLQL